MAPITPLDLFRLRCTVNDRLVERDVPVDRILLDFLREDLGLTGTKGACLEGECGSCTVLVEGVPLNSCVTLAAQAHGRSILTIEGLNGDGRMSALQQKFMESGAAQCGYCTPGLIMAAQGLLQSSPHLTEDELIRGVEANLCRCTGYLAVLDALRAAYREVHGE
jgi:carbon-monoxide dehydrogenase small subunit